MQLLSALCIFIALGDNRLPGSPNVVGVQFRMLSLKGGMKWNQTIAALGLERNHPYMTFSRVFGDHRSQTSYFEVWPAHTLTLTFDGDCNCDWILREVRLFPGVNKPLR